MTNKIKLISSFLLVVYVGLSISLNFIHNHPLLIKTEFEAVVQDDSGLCAVCHFSHSSIAQSTELVEIEFSFDSLQVEGFKTYHADQIVSIRSNRAPPSLS